MFEGLFQPMHLLLILGIALLFFGPKRLPELGKGLGTSIRDFKDAMSGPKPDDKSTSQLEAPKAAAATVPPNPAGPQANPVPAAPAQAGPSVPPQAAPPQGPTGGSAG